MAPAVSVCSGFDTRHILVRNAEMSSRFFIITSGLMFLLFVVSVASALEDKQKAAPEHTKRLSTLEIEQLIVRLSSDDFHEREAATETLKRPEAVVAVLRASRNTINPEVRRRLMDILRAIRRGEAEKRLARLPEYVKRHQLDRFVETMVAYREFITAEHDALVRTFVKDTYAAAVGDKKLLWSSELPLIGSRSWPEETDRTRKPLIIGNTALAPQDVVTIASDRIGPDENRNYFANRGVGLCNGDIDIDSIDSTVLIATGKVRGFTVQTSMIVCLGDVDVHSGDTSVIVTAGRFTPYGVVDLGWTDKKESIIRERETSFFRTWKLYSATEAGISLRLVFGIVSVSAIRPDSPLAMAGVKPGDVLVRVDGSPVRTVRDANHLLCRATVASGVAALTILRGSKLHEINTTLYEW